MSSTIEQVGAAPADSAVSEFLNEDEPIRAEQFGLEHLETHARSLAAAAARAPVFSGLAQLRRIRRNKDALIRAHHLISQAWLRQETFGADAEWLLDNFHIIADVLGEIQTDLPVGYYRVLPKMDGGPLRGFPRIYVLALELVAHCDSSLDETNITRFVSAYQSVTPLTIGELWAVPIMLRAVLIENLRRLADHIVHFRQNREEAKAWAAHFLTIPDRERAAAAILAAPSALRPEKEWSDSFLFHMLEFVRADSATHACGVDCIVNYLAERGRTATELLRREQARQAANQVSIGNCVTSLRMLSALDWTDFFERTSLVEAILREDPAGVYALQDFATRDRYRRIIEELARGSDRNQLTVARQVLELAGREFDDPESHHAGRIGEPEALAVPARSWTPAAPASHVGYYLIDRGLTEFQSALHYVPPLRGRLQNALLNHPRTIYFGSLTLVTMAIVAALAVGLWGATSGWTLAPILLLALLPASALAIGVVNYFAAWLAPPRVLPKLHFKDGIPTECATFVVVPSMLLQEQSANRLIERLEVHYLSNPDPELRFALLTDLTDAPAEQMPQDEGYVLAAKNGIEKLNERYCRGLPDRFFLCHRRRQWNPVEDCWMGWERKRGKLLEFNRLLRGAADTSFSVIAGDIRQLPPIRYVITLDADTQLPRETAAKLVATLAHPLNQPRFNRERTRVIAGYGILQPRVSLSLVAARKSPFARILTGSAGLDPYTTAVSDTYQDLFGIGSFTGKGIYDVDAFEAATGSTFPENRILSHDLIEGNYARCGLVTDIEFLDGFPASYLSYARREHRWTRGDWQILDWLSPWVPGPRGEKKANLLPGVERWKIFDNLRRSLLPPVLVLILVLGWTVLPGSAWLWSGVALLVLGWPLFVQMLNVGPQLCRGLSRGRHWTSLPENIAATAGQVLLSVVFLADQARLFLDAIGRTLFRLYVKRRRLLEWETSASAERRLGGGLVDHWRTMWHAPAFALAVGLLIFSVKPEAVMAAAPFIIGWFLSPLVAFWVSLPSRVEQPDLGVAERQQLRRLAAKTWRFFDTFVGDEDHWLPPDNVQEERKEAVAHRTSPTNVGLYLLSCLTAHDFGYLSLSGLAERLEKTFATLARLERWHGHLCNWYDTRTLQSLQPGYVSTVDSGNLMGFLVALKHGLLEKTKENTLHGGMRDGLLDTIDLISETLRSLESPSDAGALDTIDQMEASLKAVRLLLETDVNLGTDGLAPPPELALESARLNDFTAALGLAIQETQEDLQYWVGQLTGRVKDWREESPDAAASTRERLTRLSEQAGKLAAEMDFKILYNEHRNLFSVGFNLALGRLDNAHYDLLASEACITSFLAIARGDVPKKHWFQVGRPLARSAGSVVLVSWGGTMFEYLMPRLLLPSFSGTLLDESQRSAVRRQIEYGRARHVPWGISESAYSAMDTDRNYQYQAFGVPGLGLKRGLARDLVVAPYATFLALDICPRLALKNLDRLAKEGGEGSLGFYEAIDFTRERVPPKERSVVVKCYMAHHQGMAFLALANCLLGDLISRRFRAEPIVRATELLLQERMPQEAVFVRPETEELAYAAAIPESFNSMSRRITTPHTAHPRTHLLSTGAYTVMVTNSGAGFSTCRDLDVTRWREDRTCDGWGQFCYLRDLRSGLLWSAGYLPVRHEADEYEVVYSTDKAEFRRIDAEMETHLEITVSPENHAEIRRLTLTNHSARRRYIEATSYAEIVLGPHAADLAHPAFGKLFLETEFVASAECLLCRRRPRAADEKPVWGIHVMAIDGPTEGTLQYETDRGVFLGRGRTTAYPAALDGNTPLSGTTGPVLDPIFSLRRWLRIAPGASVQVAFTTAVADSREVALTLADHYHNFHGVQRAFELAWAHSQVELRHLHLSAEQAHLYQRLAAHVIYAGSALRAPAEILAANRQGQRALWRYGISGDNSIVLVRVAEAEELAVVREVLQAHNYWRLKGFIADLVILNEHEAGYFEDLQQQLQEMVRGTDDRALIDKPGGVFIRKAAQISPEDLILLKAAARCVLVGQRGALVGQLDRPERAQPPQLPRAKNPKRPEPFVKPKDDPKRLPLNAAAGKLLFVNGLGGFTPDGAEYVIHLPLKDAAAASAPSVPSRAPIPGGTNQAATFPPAPWINVVSNPSFGFLVSESGAGYTWANNSQMNRLSPWNNDPVSDSPGEVVYLRDEATGEVWTPTPLPAPSRAGYVVRHGQGYTVFEHIGHGLNHELLLYVPAADPIKIIRLRVRNLGRQARRLSATFYAEWILGTVRDATSPHLVTEVDSDTGALFARNAFNPDFASHVAFADVNLRPRAFTADRTEFLGRNGATSAPIGMAEAKLTGAVGPGRDACAALQAPFDLKPGEEKEILFFLGEAPTVEDARRLLKEYRATDRAAKAFDEVKEKWRQTLGVVSVRTPNAALDLLVNRWLIYQVQSCRVWGRSALYQSGGAYGFRDQLQDVMALVYAAPHEARTHILRAASRQFREGDVQHWWHPSNGGGIRTRFSDDCVWLPFVVCHYVRTTGDAAIMDEAIRFLQAPLLRHDQDEDYRIPEISEESASLYEHCVRSFEHSFHLGEHGLPLMGTGDWNDGMNWVGKDGKGESVWDGWFFLTALQRFATLSDERGHPERAAEYRDKAEQLKRALAEHAWDGAWYRRAYFDDGTPLGSAANTECRIDSLTQSWAVISGAAGVDRARQAMAAAEGQLVQSDEKLVLLFTPPFDKSDLQPGYIKGYVPGIRENGGQYTHAATWVVQATAMLGQGNRALALFDLLNPILHSGSPEAVSKYRVEPYVVAGDVYSNPHHIGRGGWTWYTGSAAWLYRVALENILGFHLHGNELRIDPCISQNWRDFEMTYRHGSATYHIKVENPSAAQKGVQSVSVDGAIAANLIIELHDDGKQHEVVVVLGG